MLHRGAGELSAKPTEGAFWRRRCSTPAMLQRLTRLFDIAVVALVFTAFT